MENLNYNNLDISIIIPTYNFKNSFQKVFQKILNQTINPLEIIIIDSYASDEFTQNINDK